MKYFAIFLTLILFESNALASWTCDSSAVTGMLSAAEVRSLKGLLTNCHEEDSGVIRYSSAVKCEDGKVMSVCTGSLNCDLMGVNVTVEVSCACEKNNVDANKCVADTEIGSRISGCRANRPIILQRRTDEGVN